MGFDGAEAEVAPMKLAQELPPLVIVSKDERKVSLKCLTRSSWVKDLSWSALASYAFRNS